MVRKRDALGRQVACRGAGRFPDRSRRKGILTTSFVIGGEATRCERMARDTLAAATVTKSEKPSPQDILEDVS
jgi:hypothetical protein